MKREARANLIFLGVFLLLALPGAVLLFKKKMDPTAPPLFMPDYVRRKLPYMASQLSPESEVKRYVPELTGGWVESINREHGITSGMLLDGHRAVISDDRLIQVLSIQREAGATHVGLLAWDDAHDADPKHYRITASAGEKDFDGKLEQGHRSPMPLPVKKELMYAGVIQPPPGVTWLWVAFDAPLPPNTPCTLRVTYQDAKSKPVTSTVTIPAN